MVITVSVGDFRQNIAKYLEEVHKGTTVILQDSKRKRVVARVIPEEKYSGKDLLEWIQSHPPVFTAKNHPEWATKKKVIEWVRKSRAEAERTFDDPPRF